MNHCDLHTFSRQWLPEIEREMKQRVSNAIPALATHYGMMRYHLGWVDEQFHPQRLPTGKHLRPLFCLLACAEMGSDPVQALPAATALELWHNFSLIHDDIEDGDEMRRHRPTVWKQWGVPQAINAGDGIFALAIASILRLPQQGVAAANTLRALDLFTQATVTVIEGQHLDMSFEQRATVTIDEYLQMIGGKTAALLGASVAIGGLVGGASLEQVAALQAFGHAVGMAFQIQDDILGIWGDPAVTGKATGNDILRHKKSLPMLYALNHVTLGPRVAALLAGEMDSTKLPTILALLHEADARQLAETVLCCQHKSALTALEAACGTGASQSHLWTLAESLLERPA